MIDINNFFSSTEIAKFSEEEKNRLLQASKLAKKAHKGQIRRSGENYLEHPLTVAKILIEWEMSINMVIAAILHDCIEDSTITIEEIRLKFGDEVATYVYALTNNFFRKGFLEKNLDFYAEEPNVIIIKLADRLHNMRTMNSMPKEIRNKKSKDTLSVYVPLARALKMYDVAEELTTLAKKYHMN